MKSLMPLSDQQLINLYVAGNSAAFSTLVLRYKSKVYSSIYLLVKDKYLAEDMFQDVFIKVIDKLTKGHYTEEGKFLPWVMRIAHNMCLDHFRKVKRTPTIKNNDEVDIFDMVSFSEPNAEQRMITGQSHDRVRKMLDMLPEDQREIIIMRHYADLTFKEIAALKDISINTALGRMRYGLINLRKVMVEKQIAL
ncbi:MAG: sigma-70 family RNA polymerase sigma factor [Bacteroidota bacterium]|nr:sigma-70 family RNA polymerase sigma factor [Ferruginibacter sp.]